MTQFYQLTLKDAITQHQAGFLSSAGLLFNYFKIKFAPGWKIQINQPKICQELGLSRDQFYRGLRLIKQNFPNLKLYRITSLIGEFEPDNPSPDNDTTSKEPVAPTANPVVDSSTPVVGSLTPIAKATNPVAESTTPVAPSAKPVVDPATNTPSKPSQTNESGDSPDLNSNSYQTFLNSLSNSQRENFFGFCQRQASQLPEPPILVRKWIEHNWLDLCYAWAKHSPAVARLNNKTLQTDWSFHPHFKRWKFLLESEYDAPYFLRLIKNGGTREERKAFAHWAIANGVVTLPEGIEVDGL